MRLLELLFPTSNMTDELSNLEMGVTSRRLDIHVQNNTAVCLKNKLELSDLRRSKNSSIIKQFVSNIQIQQLEMDTVLSGSSASEGRENCQ